MWRSQAEAEGLTLLKADNKAGYFGVNYNTQASKSKPYQARVWRGGKQVSLGSFATAEEAALCIARSPEGQAAAKKAAAAPPLTSEEVGQQAEAEGLTLLEADNKAGYYGVTITYPNPTKPYKAQVSRGGKVVSLGTFATAEEAALCIARSPEGRAAAKRPAAAPPLTSEEARQQAEAEGLTLLKADNKAGYFGVSLSNPGYSKPYKAEVRRGGRNVSLGSFATAEEAALCIARSPEGQAAAKKSATARLLISEEARQQAEAEGLTLLKAQNSTGYFGVYLVHPGQPKPYQAKVRRGGKFVSLGSFATAEEATLCAARSPEGRAAAQKAAAARLLTSEEEEVVQVLDAEEVVEEAESVQMVEVVAVMEPEVVVDEGGRLKGRPKRRRNA